MINLISYKKIKGGMADLSYEVDQDFINLVSRELGVEKPTDEQINDYVIRLIESAVEGFDNEQVKTPPKRSRKRNKKR